MNVRCALRVVLFASVCALFACTADVERSSESDALSSSDVASLVTPAPTADLDQLRGVADALSADGVSLLVSAPTPYLNRFAGFFEGVRVELSDAPEVSGEASDAFYVSPGEVQFEEAVALTLHYDARRFDSERVEVVTWDAASGAWLAEPVLERLEGRIIALTARSGLVRLVVPDAPREPAVRDGVWSYLAAEDTSVRKSGTTARTFVRLYVTLDPSYTACLAHGTAAPLTVTPMFLSTPGAYKRAVDLELSSRSTLRTFVSTNTDCSTNDGELYPSPGVRVRVGNVNLPEAVCDGTPLQMQVDLDGAGAVTPVAGVDCPDNGIAVPQDIQVRLQSLATALDPGQVACAEVNGVAYPGSFSAGKWRATASLFLPGTFNYRWFVSSDASCSDVLSAIVPGGGVFIFNGQTIGESSCDDVGGDRVAVLDMDAAGAVTEVGTQDCTAGLAVEQSVQFRLQSIGDLPLPTETVCVDIEGERSALVLAGNKYKTNASFVLPSAVDFFWFYSSDSDCSTVGREVYPPAATPVVAGVVIPADKCENDGTRSVHRVQVNGLGDVDLLGTEACVGASGAVSLPLFYQIFRMALDPGEVVSLSLCGGDGVCELPGSGPLVQNGSKYKLFTTVSDAITDVDTVVGQLASSGADTDFGPGVTDVLLYEIEVGDGAGADERVWPRGAENVAPGYAEWIMTLDGLRQNSCVLIDPGACRFTFAATSTDDGDTFASASGPNALPCPGDPASDLNMDDIHDACQASCLPTGAEVCDGTDNDCDGTVDNLPGGVSCGAASSRLFQILRMTLPADETVSPGCATSTRRVLRRAPGRSRPLARSSGSRPTCTRA